VIMARPPYLPIACLLLLPTAISLRKRLVCLLVMVGPVLSWSMIAAHWSQRPASAAQLTAQLHALAHHPLMFAHALRAALGLQIHELFPWGREFIGVLGWLDTTLPPAYHLGAGLLLLAALALSCPPVLPPFSGRARLGALLCIVAAALAILFFQYLSWTPVGAAYIDGVQGRYFLPLAAILPLALPRLPIPLAIRRGGGVLICLFPAFSIALALRAIVSRYYLS